MDVRPLRLWFALLGGFGAWVLHLGLSYAAVPFVCGTGSGGEAVLHLLTLGAALVAGAAAGVGWGAWRRFRAVADEPEIAAPAGAGGARPARPDPAGPDAADPGAGTGRFLAVSGTLASAFFLFLILVEGLPALLLSEPCRFVPLREQPIVMATAAPAVAEAAEQAMAVTGTAPAVERSAPAVAGPAPTAWNSGWSVEARLLVPLYLLGLAYLTGVARLWRRAGRGRGIPAWRVAAYLGGVAALLAALVSPIDAHAQALFSVHMVQHLLLMVVAAPLIVLGDPGRALLWVLPRRWRRALGRRWAASRLLRGAGRALFHPVGVLVVHVAALWAWHVPALYEAALRVRWVHHLEHASFLLTAILFWWVLARAGRRGQWPGYGAGILYVFATALQSGALGALLLFAPEPWYPSHRLGAVARGLDPLADQQLAGVLMWVPPGLVYALAACLLLVAWMRRSEAEVARREGRAPLSADSPHPETDMRPKPTPVLALVFLVGAPLLAGGCEIGRSEVAPRQVAGGDPERGREEIRRQGCGACHTVPGVDGATGRVAPPLTAYADRGFVAGVLPNNADALVRWIQDPPSVNPQTAMPDLGVTEEEARHIAAYLYTLR